MYQSIGHKLKFDSGSVSPDYKRIMTINGSPQAQENVPWAFLSLSLPI